MKSLIISLCILISAQHTCFGMEASAQKGIELKSLMADVIPFIATNDAIKLCHFVADDLYFSKQGLFMEKYFFFIKYVLLAMATRTDLYTAKRTNKRISVFLEARQRGEKILNRQSSIPLLQKLDDLLVTKGDKLADSVIFKKFVLSLLAALRLKLEGLNSLTCYTTQSPDNLAIYDAIRLLYMVPVDCRSAIEKMLKKIYGFSFQVTPSQLEVDLEERVKHLPTELKFTYNSQKNGREINEYKDLNERLTEDHQAIVDLLDYVDEHEQRLLASTVVFPFLDPCRCGAMIVKMAIMSESSCKSIVETETSRSLKRLITKCLSFQKKIDARAFENTDLYFRSLADFFAGRCDKRDPLVLLKTRKKDQSKLEAIKKAVNACCRLFKLTTPPLVVGKTEKRSLSLSTSSLHDGSSSSVDVEHDTPPVSEKKPRTSRMIPQSAESLLSHLLQIEKDEEMSDYLARIVSDNDLMLDLVLIVVQKKQALRQRSTSDQVELALLSKQYEALEADASSKQKGAEKLEEIFKQLRACIE